MTIYSMVIVAAVMGMLASAAENPIAAVKGETITAPAVIVENDLAEAKLRARLLHETIHGSLQVMHRDFFREGMRLPIPSESLEDVFSELEKTWKVKVKWMAVNAKAMNVDHRPDSHFEQQAVKAITEGAEMFESSDGGNYRYAGAITLGNQCLKCHVPDRTSLEDRKAALVISMPIKLALTPAK